MGDEFQHFVDAQKEVLPLVERELTQGRKREHWMWFVFPQVAGLGASEISKRYALPDLPAARRYLAHPLLGPRLERHVEMLMAHDASAKELLGTPDDLKFRSCLTLFFFAAGDGPRAALFWRALERFFSDGPDELTMTILGQGPYRT